MRYTILGRSGLRVAKIALGTMTFGPGEAWSRSREASRAVFEAYAAAGGNFIDTANMYTGGESERIIGELIAGDRERFVVATKYANAVPGAGDPNAAGMHRKSLTQSLDGSLQRLGVDYIDLYYVHWWDFTTPVEEVHRALDDAVRVGKILHLGLSDVPAWAASRMQTLSDLRGWAPVAAMQLEYSLVQRSIEREHLPFAKVYDVGITAWSPLAGGILTGKYADAARGGGPQRMDSMQLQPLDERNVAIASAVSRVADRLGSKPAQVALAWILNRGVIPVVGATRPEQLADNLAALDLDLDAAVMAELDEASRIDLGHPYQMVGWEMQLALGYAGMFENIEIPGYPFAR